MKVPTKTTQCRKAREEPTGMEKVRAREGMESQFPLINLSS